MGVKPIKPVRDYLANYRNPIFARTMLAAIFSCDEQRIILPLLEDSSSCVRLALLVHSQLSYGHSPKVGYSHAYLTISKDKLSGPYALVPYDTVSADGIIMAIVGAQVYLPKPEREFLERFTGRGAEFLLTVTPLGKDDALYLKKEIWEELRDAGVVSNTYVLQVKIQTVAIGGKPVSVYPLRDIS